MVLELYEKDSFPYECNEQQKVLPFSNSHPGSLIRVFSMGLTSRPDGFSESDRTTTQTKRPKGRLPGDVRLPAFVPETPRPPGLERKTPL